MVGDDPVDLLRHRAVEAAQARLDVADREPEPLGAERRGEGRVDVARDQDEVRRLVAQDGLEALDHPRGLLRVRPRADAEHVVGLRAPRARRRRSPTSPGRSAGRCGRSPSCASPKRARAAAITGAILTKFGRVPSTWTMRIRLAEVLGGLGHGLRRARRSCAASSKSAAVSPPAEWLVIETRDLAPGDRQVRVVVHLLRRLDQRVDELEPSRRSRRGRTPSRSRRPRAPSRRARRAATRSPRSKADRTSRAAYPRCMRIASLVPSATEALFALGLGDDVVAVTHECDHPPRALELPRLTSSVIGEGLSPAEIDAAVREVTGRGESLYGLDESALAELRPDLIVTQALCAVCAVSFDDVRAVAGRIAVRARGDLARSRDPRRGPRRHGSPRRGHRRPLARGASAGVAAAPALERGPRGDRRAARARASSRSSGSTRPTRAATGSPR